MLALNEPLRNSVRPFLLDDHLFNPRHSLLAMSSARDQDIPHVPAADVHTIPTKAEIKAHEERLPAENPASMNMEGWKQAQVRPFLS